MIGGFSTGYPRSHGGEMTKDICEIQNAVVPARGEEPDMYKEEVWEESQWSSRTRGQRTRAWAEWGSGSTVLGSVPVSGS